MLINHHQLLAVVALLGVTVVLLRPTPLPVTSAESPERSALETQPPRDVDLGDPTAIAQTPAQRRAQAIDAERLRLIARGELTAREATPAELRLIRSGGPLRAARTP